MLTVASETARFAPARRAGLPHVQRYEQTMPQIDFAVRNTRVLARYAARQVRAGEPAPQLADAVGELASAVWVLAAQYEHPDRPTALRDLALRAARTAEEIHDREPSLMTTQIVGQVRTVAVDLVRAAESLSGERPAHEWELPTEELLAERPASDGARPLHVRRAQARSVSGAQRHARPRRGDRARRPGRPRRLRRRRAPPPRLRGLLAGRRARRRGRAHAPDPAHERGHRAQLRRPGARLPGLRDARPALRRPRGDHGRARLVHRVVPALRLRPRRLRRAVRREARPAARAARRPSASRGRARHRAPLRRRRRLPAPAAGPAADLDRRRRHAAVGRARRARSACRSRSRSSAARPSASRRCVDLYRDAARQAGHDPATLPVGDQLARVRRARRRSRRPTSSSRPTPG